MHRRIGRSTPETDPAQTQGPPAAQEALVLHRSWLIRLLKSALTELHEHFREIAATSVAQEELQTIRYWEEVLQWVKERQGADLVVVERRENASESKEGQASPVGRSRGAARRP
jgi:hypothetical protein